ncbi:hypothetical protein RBH26_06965 [Natronolimnohabitans sp. A-GB9]|uniref:hypothetical protein n=1 Tax=Natronolimnohabitans sp. A-GB9 TaxID=3069757 RepID=UPI000AED93A6|nr:hypothetical protein [Natronolimnohabitans sp. A-GB9]MDQ2050222.1 hypothetical protein [Natronolimnohabitans sp. A-GB9]
MSNLRRWSSRHRVRDARGLERSDPRLASTGGAGTGRLTAVGLVLTSDAIDSLDSRGPWDRGEG